MMFTSLHANFDFLSTAIRRESFEASKSLARLSSGNAITRAADDVANLSISTSLSSRVKSLNAVGRNIAQASSLLQVADGGLSEIGDVLQRMQSLSVMANGGVANDKERSFLNQEFQQLANEIERLAQETRFNGVQVLTYEPREAVSEEVVEEVAGLSLQGTVADDTLSGSNGNDEITPFDGDDTIEALAGNDQINAGVQLQPGLRASIYRSAGGIGGLAAAEAVVSGAGAPDATFIATSLDYPNGAVNNQNGPVNNFLGADAATLDPPAFGAVAGNRLVYVFEGVVNVPADGIYSFGVSSDDGFNLQIDGATVTQFTGNRGFNNVPTTGNVNLTEGQHDFRLIYWENSGSEGLETFSSLTGGGILNDTVTAYQANVSDGNDTIDGGDGEDVVIYEGNRADYTITQISPTEYEVRDDRVDSPNGTDTLLNVERVQFADGSEVLGSGAGAAGAGGQGGVFTEDGRALLRFQVSSQASDTVSYEVVDASLEGLFGSPFALDISTVEGAVAANKAVRSAIDTLTSYRAEVGSKQQQVEIIGENNAVALRNQDAARAALADTDVARVSTELALQTVQTNLSIAMNVQTNNLHRETVLGVIEGGVALTDVLSTRL